MPLTFPFEKMQGVGNDFVVAEARHLPGVNLGSLAIRICDRHLGVGADGLLILAESDEADYRMRMFNPDGTEDDCGNGLRCVVRYVRRHFTPGDYLTFETLPGVRQTEVLEHNDRESRIRVNMGQPRLSPPEIPMLTNRPDAIRFPIDLHGEIRRFTCMSTGSTHAVTFLEEPAPDETFLSESPLIEHHPLFPERTSVIWAWIAAPGSLRIRIWERGVGETLGCGTGACAAAVAAQLEGRARGTISIVSRGGSLEIEWNDEIWMTGPAVSVFEGRWAEDDRRGEESAGE
ncbi:MAG TPA: diaminopimelate epimerase [Armatimonadota bacterium]|nr:diaminopimelate epimerase [Armatimonadota bacterium]